MPFTGDVPYFLIMDNTQVSHCVWGFVIDSPHNLRYETWTNSAITVGNFGGHPGDALQISVWNPQSTGEVAWGGNVPGGPKRPVISSACRSAWRQRGYVLLSSLMNSCPHPTFLLGPRQAW